MTSRGVPKSRRRAEQVELDVPVAVAERDDDLRPVVGAAVLVPAGVAAQLVVQVGQRRVGGGPGLPPQPLQQVCPPLTQVADPRRHPFRVQAEPQHVHRRAEQVRGRALGQQRHRRVGVEEVPGLVDDHRRVRLVPAQQPAQRRPDRLQLRVLQRAPPVRGGEAAGQQQRVPVPQRDLEVLAEPQDHLAGRPGAPGLDEAQVPGRDLGPQRELELAEPSAFPPLPQQQPDRPGGSGHAVTLGPDPGPGHYLPGNRHRAAAAAPSSPPSPVCSPRPARAGDRVG